jgi:hypothetical protein
MMAADQRDRRSPGRLAEGWVKATIAAKLVEAALRG